MLRDRIQVSKGGVTSGIHFNSIVGYNWVYHYAYKIDNPGYVYEYAFRINNSAGSLIKNGGSIFMPTDGKLIGFDVTIEDHDSNTGVDRNMYVWKNDGTGPAQDESWNNMDDCGVIMFKESPPNDSISCDPEKALIIFFDVPTDSIVTYEWNTDGGELVYSEKNLCKIKWTTPGEKNIILITAKISGEKDTTEKKVTVYPKFSVSLGDDIWICKNVEFTISPTIENGVKPFEYLWNNEPGDSVFRVK